MCRRSAFCVPCVCSVNVRVHKCVWAAAALIGAIAVLGPLSRTSEPSVGVFLNSRFWTRCVCEKEWEESEQKKLEVTVLELSMSCPCTYSLLHWDFWCV